MLFIFSYQLLPSAYIHTVFLLGNARKIIIFRYFKTPPYTVTLQCQIN
ncbi:hypothetical protein BACCOP_02620 [Phocaeicola coprocola DSM 17136]|uniref:Uncharacterized protein n=1 Tax=Phocaeicola coprocola DSM 17136 TaxID=470145 RepID=B3JL38_9BACT|nr:hypothetical protein BACCOP_02620 [Phocaeicola coprocola DSM 17136]